MYTAVCWMFTIGMALAEGEHDYNYRLTTDKTFVTVILTLRCWAVWGRDRRLTIGLPIFFILCWVPIVTIVAIFIPTLRCKGHFLSHDSCSDDVFLKLLQCHYRASEDALWWEDRPSCSLIGFCLWYTRPVSFFTSSIRFHILTSD